jgi:hypothetical protein
MLDKSLTVIEYLPALTFVTFVPLFLSVVGHGSYHVELRTDLLSSTVRGASGVTTNQSRNGPFVVSTLLEPAPVRAFRPTRSTWSLTSVGLLANRASGADATSNLTQM